MTDDVRQIEAMQQRFGSRVRSVDVTRSDGDEEGVHHTANDKQKIAEEVIVDMLIAAQSETFFGYGFSYLACCVKAFRSKEQRTVLLPFDLTNRFYEIPHPGKFNIYYPGRKWWWFVLLKFKHSNVIVYAETITL